jgi:hypothetical protein
MPTSKNKLSEDLKKALEAAREADEKTFKFKGKTFAVEDFPMDDEEEEDMEESKTKVDEIELDSEEEEDEEDMEESRTLDIADSIVLDVESEISSSISEDVDALFNGENLTEDFKDKATTIFESAVNLRVSQIADRLQEEANNKVAASVADETSKMADQVDEYLTYVAEQWVAENQIAIDKGVRTDICESFMSGLKTLFEAHHIDMPQEKFDVMQEQNSQIAHLQAQLNDSLSANAAVAAQARASEQLAECTTALAEESSNLTDTEAEKLYKLAEGIDFEDVEQFKEKLSVLKESYFGKGRKASRRILDEDDISLPTSADNTVYTSPNVEQYVNFISSRSTS